jgi:hypothetical protein
MDWILSSLKKWRKGHAMEEMVGVGVFGEKEISLFLYSFITSLSVYYLYFSRIFFFPAQADIEMDLIYQKMPVPLLMKNKKVMMQNIPYYYLGFRKSSEFP